MPTNSPRNGSEPILVMGYMHSGTTLLRNVLRSHGSVFVVPGETKFFQKLPAFRRQYPDLHNDQALASFVEFVVDVALNGHTFHQDGRPKDRNATIGPERLDAIIQEAKQNRDHAAIFRIVMDHLAREFGKTRWLVKKPTAGFFLESVLQAVPDALFVEIVRDPRDVLASKKTRRQGVWTGRYRPEQRAAKHLEKAYDPFWDSLSWKSTALALRRASARWPGRFLSVRYEDLVADPEGQVRAICAFLGMDFDPAMLEVSWCNTAEQGDRPAEQGDGIVRGSVDRWRRVLTPTEAALCETLTGKEMARLGYDRGPAAWRHLALTPLLAARGGVELVRRPIRRWRMGGPAYFAIVMNTYWKRFVQLARG